MSPLACRIAALALACWAVAGCDADPEDTCPWSVDALLGQVGASVVDARVDCGSTNGAFPDEVESLYACFAAAPTNPGAEFTINNCTDCAIPTTYVSIPTPEYFAILREEDQFGDQLRVAKVTRCSSIDLAESVACADAEQIYSCSAPLR